MAILPMISATKTLDKVLCLAADIKHSTFENGQYNICNDVIEHVRTLDDNSKITYQPVPFSFNIPSQSETDDSKMGISNVNLVSSRILKTADDSLEDIIVACWLIVADYNGGSNWISLGEYILGTSQVETIEMVSGTLSMKTCYGINVGKYRGKNPLVFINLNHR